MQNTGATSALLSLAGPARQGLGRRVQSLIGSLERRKQLLELFVRQARERQKFPAVAFDLQVCDHVA